MLSAHALWGSHQEPKWSEKEENSLSLNGMITQETWGTLPQMGQCLSECWSFFPPLSI